MSRLQILYKAAMLGKATEAELDELAQLLVQPEKESESRHLIREAITEGYAVGKPLPSDRLFQIQQAIISASPENQSLHDDIYPAPRARLSFLKTVRLPLLKMRWAGAAAILLFIGIGGYFLNRQKEIPKNISSIKTRSEKVDILPGSNRAMLTLWDGSTIALDSAANGNLTQQGNAQVIKLADGQIVYDLKDLSTKEIIWNTMSTPRGGQYQLTLPDGSKVWLNAASSITYPVAFVETERRIKVTGEAYFEVAHNKSRPFIVQTISDTITVLGTSFNVRTFKEDGDVKTSLSQGSIKVNDRVIKPGQAYMDRRIFNTNIEQDIAWKNGIFDFDGADLASVMKQLARWYDVTIIYPEGIPVMTFGGKIGRNLTLRQILKILEKSEVKFDVDENRKTIIVHRTI